LEWSLEIPLYVRDYSCDGLHESRAKQFALCANAHLSDDKTVAKMGHPGLWLG
jgi:hypothetical protein